VPDGRKEHVAVAAIGREDGDDRQLEQVAEVGDVEIPPHVYSPSTS